VVTPKGYTKHYYAESERITSQVGRGNFSTLVTPVTDTATANRKVRRADSLVLALNPSITDTTAQLSYLTTLTNRQKDTCEAYWYHTDHLGSSSWITDSAGNPVQHLHYLPWGEDYVNQRLNDFEGARFTFSAKERDSETGLSYFGSRYYSSDLSIWLSVDPMSDKYASLSPYIYCANNPVKLVDPNGEEVWIPEVDEKGNVTYTAEQGDDYYSFVKQFDTKGKGRDVFKNAGLGTKSGDVKKGAVVKGDAVKKATGNEVLKGNWWNMTKRQKAAQLIFAVNHSKKHGDGSGVFDFNNYASGFETLDSEQLSDFYLPTKCGFVKVRNLSIWFTTSNTRSYNSPMVSQTAFDCINKYDFRFPEPGSKRSMFMFSIDNQYDEAFQTLFVK
jgi:RHS repeat-associated protein